MDGNNSDVNNNSTNGNNTQVQQQAQQQSQQVQGNSNTIDYEKIESMISKGTQQKESAILKSYFEQQGMTAEEMKQAMDTFKASKQAKAQEEQQRLQTIQQENEQLKAQIMESKINTRASIVATEMGIDAKTVPYMLKMADTSKAIDEKGEVSDEAIKNAFEQLLKDVPGLKSTSTSTNGFVVGGNNDTGDATTENELRKMFGLKPTK